MITALLKAGVIAGSLFLAGCHNENPSVRQHALIMLRNCVGVHMEPYSLCFLRMESFCVHEGQEPDCAEDDSVPFEENPAKNRLNCQACLEECTL